MRTVNVKMVFGHASLLGDSMSGVRIGDARSIERALVSGEMVRETLAACRLSRLACDLAPLGAFEGRKPGVTNEIALDLGKIQKDGERQRRTIERFAADDEHRVGPNRHSQRFV